MKVAGRPSRPPFCCWGLVLVDAHNGEHARRLLGIGRVFGAGRHIEGVVDPMERRGDESCRSK